MNTREQPAHQSVTYKNWRSRPGYLSEGDSDFESIHVLIGQFLADRHSPEPLPDASLLTDNPKFQWGYGRPLEKVINSQADLEYLMKHPQLFRNAISIIEPWEHVGQNPRFEDVRASLNVAYIAQKIADCDSIFANDTCDRSHRRWIEGSLKAAIKNATALHLGMRNELPGKD